MHCRVSYRIFYYLGSTKVYSSRLLQNTVDQDEPKVSAVFSRYSIDTNFLTVTSQLGMQHSLRQANSMYLHRPSILHETRPYSIISLFAIVSHVQPFDAKPTLFLYLSLPSCVHFRPVHFRLTATLKSKSFIFVWFPC